MEEVAPSIHERPIRARRLRVHTHGPNFFPEMTDTAVWTMIMLVGLFVVSLVIARIV